MTILCRSLRNVLMDSLSMMNEGMLYVACYMVMKRPRPLGMPKDSFWIFTGIFGTC